jgi:hypothetical protein
MAKRKANNFIVSDDDEDEDFDKSESDQSAQSEEERKPNSRKKGKAAVKDDNSDGEAEGSLPKKKPKTVKKPKVTSDSPDGEDIVVHSTSEGDKYIDLGKKKRATVRTFKGNTLLDIREFYGADGDEKPGKKGISLSIEQWQALKHSTTTIDALFAELKKK